MAVNLSKGEKVSLEKAGAGGLSKVALGLSWGMRQQKGFFGTKQVEVDLDASCLLFAGKEAVDYVWFQNLATQDGSVRHSGDDRSGGGGEDADNEVITVDLSKLPAQVDSLIFTVNSFLNDSFEGIPNARCRLIDAAGNRELARFELSLDGGKHTGMVMAKLYREGGAWHLQAIGEKGTGRTFNDMMPMIGRFL
ncbi:MAG: TerD family protein [Thiocapsa sp.]|uniref:TerD family protein n=1 Tax=Thiocapsa sp. TaxID=2024551 RepID=UPI001BCCCA05|nr:TerD family protein [Thiocapsa sp.]QVL47736.1 MAG: TerD family protein [Thiocapsa sp.]